MKFRIKQHSDNCKAKRLWHTCFLVLLWELGWETMNTVEALAIRVLKCNIYERVLIPWYWTHHKHSASYDYELGRAYGPFGYRPLLVSYLFLFFMLTKVFFTKMDFCWAINKMKMHFCSMDKAFYFV